MENKGIKETIVHSKMSRSLSKKTFFLILIMVFIVGGLAFAIGSHLFKTILSWEVREDTWSLTKSEDDIVNSPQLKKKTADILKVYDSIPESEKGDGSSEAYQSNYKIFVDSSFHQLQEEMLRSREKDETRSCFVAAVNIEEPDGRLIYLVDDDPSPKTFCGPGTWDNYDQQVLDDLVYGKEPTRLERTLGLKDHIQAMWDERSSGVVCTAASLLYQTDRYAVILCIDRNIDEMHIISGKYRRLFGLIQLGISIFVALLAVYVIRWSIVNPINRMAGAAAAYRNDRQRMVSGEDYQLEEHFADLDIRTGDEIEHLARTMTEMEEDIGDYIEHLTRMTAEKERISAELDMASSLQAGMLPERFPEFPDHEEFSLAASMTPAREVGGDFYDYYLIDEDHLALIIADVSGKGLPAALFMMGSKITISNIARMEGTMDPAEILTRVNEQICANNPLEMFVTVWLGILEISTGRLTAASAGHEYPAIRRRGSGFELYKDPRGMVIGGIEGSRYRSYELLLHPGDAIFQYTDGVTEATDPDNQLFGTDRMIDALNKEPEAAPGKLMENVNKAIDTFIKQEEQFDDTTMLCLVYYGA